jgi:predicted NBD/HSP70 family sugar kinase
VFELGGRSIAKTTDAHDGNATRTLTAVAATLTTAWRAHPHRLRAIAVAISGTVSGARLVQAPSLGWEDLDLSVLRPSDADRLAVFVGNDATFSAVGEHAQGAARGHTSALVLFIDAGIGGALIDGGRLITGAAGMSGEFGHMPFGSPRRQCRCGARGCWNAELDGAALARRLGHPTPTDEVSFSRKVIAAARHAAGAERRAAAATARALAKGTAGLVNACDPEIVVLCGLGAELLKLVPDTIDRVYREGLMATRRAAPPPLTPGTLGDRAPLIGAMEAAFAPLLAYPDSVAGDAREPTCSAATRNT